MKNYIQYLVNERQYHKYSSEMKQLSENNEEMKDFITKNLDRQVTKVGYLLMQILFCNLGFSCFHLVMVLYRIMSMTLWITRKMNTNLFLL